MAVSGSFRKKPEELLKLIFEIEEKLGRKRIFRYGPRTIDIDIIFFGDHQSGSEELTIPHPEFRKRKFVLVPAAEIEPDFCDPGSGESVKEILKKCKDPAKVKITEENEK
jgi:2-amino-4-hydroxy-6-hydroxymethyldihydropteridine diphosphokinase